MNFICHRRCREAYYDGTPLNIPYGTSLSTIGNFIVDDAAKAICYVNSELAREYFSVNDDGRGLERGKLTYAIAYAPRIRYTKAGKFRFTGNEQRIISERWSHFLNLDCDTIIFNADFFKASPEELAAMAKEVNIKV